MLSLAETEPVKVGVREFRDNLATYMLDANSPVAITRHGDTIGLYIPLRRKRTKQEIAFIQEAYARLQESMAAAGVSEDDIAADFERLRTAERQG